MSLSAEEWLALMTSLVVAGRALVVALPLAVLTAWLLARPRLPGRLLLNALVHAPLVLPPVVVGYALLLLFGVRGLIGSMLLQTLHVRLAFTGAGAALAAVIVVRVAHPLALLIVVRPNLGVSRQDIKRPQERAPKDGHLKSPIRLPP